jgi:hypothetical protein
MSGSDLSDNCSNSDDGQVNGSICSGDGDIDSRGGGYDD